jgi:aromatic-L-amino-acid/L-tryptophan decarboxylase
MKEYLGNEEGLDPSDWEETRALGHRMVDDMIDHIANIAATPVWSPIPDMVKDSFKEVIPKSPTDIAVIYEDFKKNILPYSLGNINPRFFSWVIGTGTVFGGLADMLASIVNNNVAIGDHSALYVDQQVINWCKEILNFPSSGSGLLVSSASIANITALIVARNAVSADIRKKGIHSLKGRLTAYCSTETHNCISKAIEIIGLGTEGLRKIPVNDDMTINIEVLKSTIKKDRDSGNIPFCIIGNAGTVNTGATDSLDELLEIAWQEKIWLHIDGAFGALAKLTPRFKDQLKGLEKVDSVAFDLHKWMYMPYEIGCVLFKNPELHKAAFSGEVNYLAAHERGLAGGPETISNYGMELSRGFKALKVWMSLREHGIEKYKRLINQNIDQAFYLGGQITQMEDLELLIPVTMNIVCYRYNPGGHSEEELNIMNKELLMRMHEQAVAAPSYTILKGAYAIRVAITNHRTRKNDLDTMLQGTLRIGKQLLQEAERMTFKI